jgi:methylphosphotriester-DNA--protein-cysteine methyltransferase
LFALEFCVTTTTDAISRTHGHESIAPLAREVGLTRQHLARLFDAHVGLSPKLLARVVRLRRLVESGRAGRRDWAAAALDAGYFDQAHMIGEFRALAGVTPARYFDVPDVQSAVAAAG